MSTTITTTALDLPHTPLEVMSPSAGDPETPDIEHVCERCWTLWPCLPAFLADLPDARPQPYDGPYDEEPPF